MGKTIQIPDHISTIHFDIGNDIDYFDSYIRGQELKVVKVDRWFTSVEDEKGKTHVLHGYFKGDIFQLLLTKYEEVEKLAVYER